MQWIEGIAINSDFLGGTFVLNTFLSLLHSVVYMKYNTDKIATSNLLTLK